MYKNLILIIVLLTVSSFAKEDSYIFEAKGKFAKELKKLVEKYSKDGQIDVKVIKSSGNKGFISELLEKNNRSENINIGKKIYDNNCFQCHGAHAEKSSYSNARVLSKLSKQEIIDQVYNYRRDINYGGSTRFIMYNAVDSLNEDDIQSVAAYIVNINKKDNTKTNTNVKGFVNKNNISEKSSYLQ